MLHNLRMNLTFLLSVLCATTSFQNANEGECVKRQPLSLHLLEITESFFPCPYWAYPTFRWGPSMRPHSVFGAHRTQVRALERAPHLAYITTKVVPMKMLFFRNPLLTISLFILRPLHRSFSLVQAFNNITILRTLSFLFDYKLLYLSVVVCHLNLCYTSWYMKWHILFYINSYVQVNTQWSLALNPIDVPTPWIRQVS